MQSILTSKPQYHLCTSATNPQLHLKQDFPARHPGYLHTPYHPHLPPPKTSTMSSSWQFLRTVQNRKAQRAVVVGIAMQTATWRRTLHPAWDAVKEEHIKAVEREVQNLPPNVATVIIKYVMFLPLPILQSFLYL